MSTNKLPHGLQQAVNQLGNDCMDSSAAIEAIHAAHAGHVAALARIAELEIERNDLRARLAEIEAQEPVAISKAGNLFWAGNPQDWRGVDCSLYHRPVPAQAVPMSDERIDAIAELVIKGMPDGIRGFMRTWGYQQFARALLEVCAGHYRAQAVPDGWRPMHSAPRDGTAVLAMLDGSDVAHAVRWLPDGNKFSGAAGWHVVWDLSAVAQHDGPNHWMPIPAAPEAAR